MPYVRHRNSPSLPGQPPIPEVFPDPNRSQGGTPATAIEWVPGVRWHKGANTTLVFDHARRVVVFECLVTHDSSERTKPLRDNGRYWREVHPRRSRSPSPSPKRVSYPPQPAAFSPSSKHNPVGPVTMTVPIAIPTSPTHRRSSHGQIQRPSVNGLYPSASPSFHPLPSSSPNIYTSSSSSSSSYVLDSHASFQPSYPAHMGHDPRSLAYVHPSHVHSHGQVLDYAGDHKPVDCL